MSAQVGALRVGALDGGDLGRADEGAEADPFAGGAVGLDGADGELAEGGLTEGLERVEVGDGGVFVLQDEAVVRERELGVDGVVGGGDFDGFVAGEGVLGLDDEGEGAVEGDVGFVAEGDGEGAGLLGGGGLHGDEFERGTRGLRGDFRVHGAAVFELHGGLGAVGGRDAGLGLEVKGLVVAVGCGREGLLVDFDGGDVLEADAGERGGVVAGVNLEVADGDAGGVGGEGNLVAVGAAVLLDGEGVAAGLHGLERGVEGESVLLVLVGIGLEG